MAITITWTTAGGLNQTNTWLDDAATDRILAWAKVNYPTAITLPDGTPSTQPANNAQAVRRASRSFINGLRDAARKAEKDAALAAVADPAPIDVAP